MKFRFRHDSRITLSAPDELVKEVEDGHAIIFLRFGCVNSIIMDNDNWETETNGN